VKSNHAVPYNSICLEPLRHADHEYRTPSVGAYYSLWFLLCGGTKHFGTKLFLPKDTIGFLLHDNKFFQTVHRMAQAYQL